MHAIFCLLVSLFLGAVEPHAPRTNHRNTPHHHTAPQTTTRPPAPPPRAMVYKDSYVTADSTVFPKLPFDVSTSVLASAELAAAAVVRARCWGRRRLVHRACAGLPDDRSRFALFGLVTTMPIHPTNQSRQGTPLHVPPVTAMLNGPKDLIVSRHSSACLQIWQMRLWRLDKPHVSHLLAPAAEPPSQTGPHPSEPPHNECV